MSKYGTDRVAVYYGWHFTTVFKDSCAQPRNVDYLSIQDKLNGFKTVLYWYSVSVLVDKFMGTRIF